jgi:hypothetical protein
MKLHFVRLSFRLQLLDAKIKKQQFCGALVYSSLGLRQEHLSVGIASVSQTLTIRL